MSSSPNQTPYETDEERDLYYRAVLRKMADDGAKLAASILEQSKAPHDPNTPKPDYSIQLERVSRSVRHTILLARKLAETRPEPRPAPRPAIDRAAARDQIIRGVADAIYRTHRDNPRHVEVLEAKLLERLRRMGLGEEVANSPSMPNIARDLGAARPD